MFRHAKLATLRGWVKSVHLWTWSCSTLGCQMQGSFQVALPHCGRLYGLWRSITPHGFFVLMFMKGRTKDCWHGAWLTSQESWFAAEVFESCLRGAVHPEMSVILLDSAIPKQPLFVVTWSLDMRRTWKAWCLWRYIMIKMDPDPMSWRILTWLTLWGIWKEGNIGCTSPQGRRSHGVHRDFGSNKLWLVSRGCLSFAVLHKTSLIVVHMIEICLQQQNKLTWSHTKTMLCRSSALF